MKYSTWNPREYNWFFACSKPITLLETEMRSFPWQMISPNSSKYSKWRKRHINLKAFLYLFLYLTLNINKKCLANNTIRRLVNFIEKCPIMLLWDITAMSKSTSTFGLKGLSLFFQWGKVETWILNLKISGGV